MFFENEGNKKILINILNNNFNISLRIIDWFVTNYSKKHNVFYEIYKNSENDMTFEEGENKLHKQINIYHAYKSQLKSYQKKKFDPFCRKERINFKCHDLDIETTVGQLNFFKWAIDNMVLEYITLHYKDIENDMTICYNNNKKDKKDIERKPRQELSKSASRGLNSNSHKIRLDFN